MKSRSIASGFAYEPWAPVLVELGNPRRVAGALGSLFSLKSTARRMREVMLAAMPDVDEKDDRDPAPTYEDLSALVRALVKEIDSAIALCSLTCAFTEDARIGPKYDNTLEAHGFVACRSSMESCLVLSIMRCLDHRPDSHGLTTFFELLKNDTTKANLREGILQRRREWVPEEEAHQEADELMADIEAARKRYVALKGTQQFARVRDYRHTRIAHGALKVLPKRAQPVHRDYLYYLTQETTEIVRALSNAVLGESQGFTEWAEIWNDVYTPAFFDTLMERAGD